MIAKDLAAGHGDRTLFSGLELVVAPGDVIGLVGVNGAGKTTLLRTLAGLVPVDAGAVSVSPPTATVGYLPQERERRAGETVRAFLARRTGVGPAHAAMDAAADDLATGAPGADDAYGTALDRWLTLGGADLDERAVQVTADLGLAVDLDRPMTALSGGQAARAGMASLLLSRYDVFLLDEPTNDLDLDGLQRLEEFVGGLRAGTVLVSHDREFLNRTVTAVLELDLAQQQVRLFGGGYAAYLQERELARRHAREEYDEYADRKDALLERGRMQRAWMEKGVRNARRKATDNDKHIKAFRGATSEKQAAKAKQTDRLIERLEVVEEPRKEWELRMEIAAAPRAGAVVATLRDAVVHRGPFTLGPVGLPGGPAARRAIPRAARSPGWPPGRTGSRSPARTAPVRRPCSPRCWAGCRSTPVPPHSARASWSARLTRPGSCSPGRRTSPTRSARRCRTSPTPTYGPCSPSSACAPRTYGDRRHHCRPANGPGRPSPCSRRAGSTCSSSTSRRTTSTCPPSSNSSRRWTATPVRCCWSRTTAGCLTRSS